MSVLREKCLQSLIEFVQPLYGRFFKSHKEPWKADMTCLENCPEYTLGKELYYFLKGNRLEMMAKFENHDVCHVLSGYNTDCVSESCMQFFLLGTGKKSLFVTGTVLLSILVLPEHSPKFFSAFKRGLQTKYFDDFDFENNLHVSLLYLKVSLLQEKEIIMVKY